MVMMIEQEIEQLVLKCIVLDGLKVCLKDFVFFEKYGLKNLYFFFLEYVMEGMDMMVFDSKVKGLIRWYFYLMDFFLLWQKYEWEGKVELMKCLYLEERYFCKFLELIGQEDEL